MVCIINYWNTSRIFFLIKFYLDRSVLAVRNSGALERMLDLMADSKTSFDINEKILWAISNSLIDGLYIQLYTKILI